MSNETIQITEIVREDKPAPPQPQKEKGIVGYAATKIKEVLAIFFWVYVFLKLFIFDIDVFLFDKYFPNHVWFLNFKFFIFFGTLALIWLIVKTKDILLWLLYIFFYPGIIFLWKIPFFIFKQKSWIFAFAVINTVISFFKSIKYNFIVTIFFLVSLAVIFGFSRASLIWGAVLVVFIILSIIYIHRFILVFKPSSIFQVYIKIFSGIRKNGVASFGLEESIKNLSIEELDPKQLEKWTANLQTAVLFNRVCLFVARKLRDYQNSSLNVVSYVLTILLLVVLTIFSFSVINFGLYKVNSNFFEFSSTPTFFTFFYYSFNNLLFNSIREIMPASFVSQSTSMVESFFALFLIVIFVSLLFSVRTQKHTEELNEAIKGIEEQGKEMESFIKDEYKISSIKDAMVELQKLKAGMVNFLYTITESSK